MSTAALSKKVRRENAEVKTAELESKRAYNHRWDSYEYFKKKADKDNDADAQYAIGCAYEFGKLGLKKNEETAMEYYHKAADSGHTYAQYKLGFHYETGLTKEGQTYASALVKKDDVKALMYYQKAADGGDESAQLRLAQAYDECATPGYQLLGLEKNEKKAIEYYSEAANGGDLYAEYADFRLRELREELSELLDFL